MPPAKVSVVTVNPSLAAELAGLHVSSADPMKGAPVVLDIADPTVVNSVISVFSIEGFKILFMPGLPLVGNSKFAVVAHWSIS